jgi:hypothetical protein
MYTDGVTYPPGSFGQFVEETSYQFKVESRTLSMDMF